MLFAAVIPADAVDGVVAGAPGLAGEAAGPVEDMPDLAAGVEIAAAAGVVAFAAGFVVVIVLAVAGVCVVPGGNIPAPHVIVLK